MSVRSTRETPKVSLYRFAFAVFVFLSVALLVWGYILCFKVYPALSALPTITEVS